MFKNLSHDTQNQYWQSKEATSGTSCRKYMPLEQLGQRWFITSNLWAVPSSDYFWCNSSCDSSLFACLSVSFSVCLTEKLIQTAYTCSRMSRMMTNSAEINCWKSEKSMMNSLMKNHQWYIKCLCMVLNNLHTKYVHSTRCLRRLQIQSY